MSKPILKSLQSPKDKKKTTNKDGWVNIITGLGTDKDKNTYSTLSWTGTTRSDAEALYAGDEIAQKIAKVVAYDGTREGITWNMDNGAPQADVNKYIEGEFRRLKILDTLAWAWTVARVYGGALVFISVDDGSKSLESPLRPEKVKKINALRVFDRHEVEITSSDIENDISKENFGKPNVYSYNAGAGFGNGETIRIHHTRLIRMDGVKLPTRLLIQNGYWDDSIYSGLAHAIRNYSTTHDSIALIISDFNQPVYKLQGLSEALAMDEEQLITQKLKIVDLMRSAARAIVLDKEDDFQNVSTNVAGGKDLIDLTVQRLVAGSDIPHTRLLGNSPTGLGATGTSELINYYDSVKSMQNSTLREPLEVLSDLIFQQNGAIERPEDLTFEFNPLFQQDLEKEIKTRHLQSEIDERYINMGVYDANETAESRFATGRYSFETVVEDRTDRVSSHDLAVEGQELAVKTQETAAKSANMTNKQVIDDL